MSVFDLWPDNVFASWPGNEAYVSGGKYVSYLRLYIYTMDTPGATPVCHSSHLWEWGQIASQIDYKGIYHHLSVARTRDGFARIMQQEFPSGHRRRYIASPMNFACDSDGVVRLPLSRYNPWVAGVLLDNGIGDAHRVFPLSGSIDNYPIGYFGKYIEKPQPQAQQPHPKQLSLLNLAFV